MSMNGTVVGIDLGTTNSSVGVVRDNIPTLVPIDGNPLLPSVVGLAPDGTLLVGQAAQNQYHLYPDRTVRSVKRQMGEEKPIMLGERAFTPVEISAMILRRLKRAAEEHLGEPVERAVITVPAYFSDAQRTATKEAGEVAGFKVERILNEPTAAALCYVGDDDLNQTYLVYDLGGGTFDVSIVRTRGEITEVLASHGDTALGGDDFDQELCDLLRQGLLDDDAAGPDPLEGKLQALARLNRAAESAKIHLSTHPFARVTEEHLVEIGGVPRHLDQEISRSEYEDLIEPLVSRTKDSVQTALRDAGVLARDIDDVILVGGATRTPLVARMLSEQMERAARMDIDPDKAVALGAALQAARVAGDRHTRILVDVTPFTFGTSAIGELNGRMSQHKYRGIVHRNTPLPTRQSEVFYTMVEGQEQVLVTIYQGEQEDARLNLQIGEFMVEGLDPEAPAGSPIVFDLRLDVNGILKVEVSEKHTGLSKQVTIEDAFRKLSEAELEEARSRVRDAFGEEDFEQAPPAPGGSSVKLPPAPDDLVEEDQSDWVAAGAMLERGHRSAQTLEGVDKAEVEELCQELQRALDAADLEKATELSRELGDVLFYLDS